jgi:uncharacterized membrane protein
MAAELVIGLVYFPSSAAFTQTLNAFLTFGIAFIARPVRRLIWDILTWVGACVSIAATVSFAAILLLGKSWSR